MHGRRPTPHLTAAVSSLVILTGLCLAMPRLLVAWPAPALSAQAPEQAPLQREDPLPAPAFPRLAQVDPTTPTPAAADAEEEAANHQAAPQTAPTTPVPTPPPTPSRATTPPSGGRIKEVTPPSDLPQPPRVPAKDVVDPANPPEVGPRAISTPPVTRPTSPVPEVAPPVRPKPQPSGPRVEWSSSGLVIQPQAPRLTSLVRAGDGQVAAGFERLSGESTARTLVFDVRTGQLLRRHQETEVLSLRDTRGDLAALNVRGDLVQLVTYVKEEDGTEGVRIGRVPQPQGASAGTAYLSSPVHFAPDGALVLLGWGRDRLYRVNPALGEVRTILPAQVLDVVDFDVSSDGELVVLDAFEQQLVWLDMNGEVLANQVLVRNETQEPRFYYLSVAAAGGRSAWVGVAVRQEDGSFAPEVQRVQGKLKERQRLLRGVGSPGFPLMLATDGKGGVYAGDENGWIYHLSSSTQLLQAFSALAFPGASSAQANPAARIFLGDSGTELPGFGSTLDASVPRLVDCYAKLLQVKPRAAGSYKLLLTTQDRLIQRVEVYQKDFEDFGLESCVSQVLREVRFPARIGRNTLRMQLKFQLPAKN